MMFTRSEYQFEANIVTAKNKPYTRDGKRVMSKINLVDRLLVTAAKYDSKYTNAMVKAIKQYGQPKKGESVLIVLWEQRHEFCAVNAYSRRIWRGSLLGTVVEAAEGMFDQGAVMMATFIDRDWACSDRHLKFDLSRAKQKVRNALQGMNYIAVFEPAYYPDREWTVKGYKGNLIAFHCHAIIWASSQSKLRRHREAIKGRFRPIDVGGASPVLNNIGTLKDLLKVARYITKMPYEGYQCNLNDNGRVTQKPATLNPEHHYRLFLMLKPFTIFQMWFAGGHGVAIRDKALKVAYASKPPQGFAVYAQESSN